MKSLIIPAVLASLLSFTANAQVSVLKNGKTHINFTIGDDKQSAKVKVNGEIIFNDDETDVQTLSPGGRISYEKDHASLLITSDKQGRLSYEIGGKAKSSFTPDEQRLIADCVQFLIEGGVAAKERAAKLYAKGGFEAVFKEISRFRGDYVKSIYMNYLSKQPTTSTADLIKLLYKADEQLSSDYYKSTFLQTIKGAQLENKDVTTAYIMVIEDVQSDYYRAAVTKKLLSSPLSDNQYAEILGYIKRMKSDHYKAELLTAISKSVDAKDVAASYMEVVGDMQSDYYRAAVAKKMLASPLSDNQYAEILGVIKSMKSDHYKAELLSAILKSVEMSDQKFTEMVQVSSSLNSDHYKTQVLNTLLKHKSGSENRYSLTIAAMDGIKSDHYRGQLLSQLIDKNITDNNEWVSLLEYTQGIKSDYEKSRVLQQIAKVMPDEAIVKEHFLEAAKGISSDHEYGKVMRSIQTKI